LNAYRTKGRVADQDSLNPEPDPAFQVNPDLDSKVENKVS